MAPHIGDRSPLSLLPSVDRLLRASEAQGLIARHGRTAVAAAIRAVLADTRSVLASAGKSPPVAAQSILAHVATRLDAIGASSLRPVFNLTGTIVHTNLGRAPLPTEAVDALTAAARGPTNLEFDLETGSRGDRDHHVEAQICRLTGAEAATVVNNNAAAVLLVLNTLASKKDVPTSRGELIEIGGAFRMPEIMSRAGCRLREVGTTNRVHLSDYAEAIGPRTGLVVKVHTSNYAIVGFTAQVPEQDLARLCRERGVPFLVDLGSGALVDLRQYGLPREPTPSEALANGADLVTFSGDKLLGGPQAGIIVGRADLVARISKNPLKRALRVDKLTIAALSSVLALYHHPENLPKRLPVLRVLTRQVADIQGQAERVRGAVAARLGERAVVTVVRCDSQIGSGALPTNTIASAGLAIQPRAHSSSVGTMLKRTSAAFRALPVPVIGRIHENAFLLDLRALDDEDTFTSQLTHLKLDEATP